MSTAMRERAFELFDRHPAAEDLLAQAASGLVAREKTLPCKLLYDEAGSRLFEEICELPEYYPTRTEIGILRGAAVEIASLVGPRCALVELGSGSSAKTRILLDHLVEPAYVPVDIARTQLEEAVEGLVLEYPDVEYLPVCQDYTRELWIPPAARARTRRVAFFPGSTIGNFEPEEAEAFLRRIAAACGPGGALLIGVDLRKDRGVLERAYDDSEGVTAAFNLNLLRRLNRECGTDFDLSAFRHRARYDEVHGRIEMHLVSQRAQVIRLGNDEIEFREGEHITTEHSYKYDLAEFGRLASRAGFRPERVWTDPAERFSVHYLGC